MSGGREGARGSCTCALVQVLPGRHHVCCWGTCSLGAPPPPRTLHQPVALEGSRKLWALGSFPWAFLSVALHTTCRSLAGFAKLSWGRGGVRGTILGTQWPYGGRNQDLWPFELEECLKVYSASISRTYCALCPEPRDKIAMRLWHWWSLCPGGGGTAGASWELETGACLLQAGLRLGGKARTEAQGSRGPGGLTAFLGSKTGQTWAPCSGG